MDNRVQVARVATPLMPPAARTATGRLPLGIPLAAGFGVALAAWLAAVGDVSEYFRYSTPPGQVAYIFSKLAGLLAGTLLTLQVVLVLLRDSRHFRGRFAWTRGQHMALGVLTLCAVVVHVALFVSAASLRGDALALNLLVPVFGHDPYRTGVSLGALGLILLLAVAPLGNLLRRGGNRRRVKNVHQCGAIALGLGIAHALVIGSEKSSIIALAVCGVAALVAIARRVLRG